MLPEKNVNGITFRIRHTMLPVSNMERTLDFYTRLLGMGVQRIRDVPERGERVRYLGYPQGMLRVDSLLPNFFLPEHRTGRYT